MPSPASEPERYARHGRWAGDALAALSPALANSFGRFAYGVFLPAIIHPLLGGSKILSGWAAAFGALGYLVGSLVLHRLDRRGLPLRSPLSGGLALAAAAAALGATATSAAQLIGALFVFGLASAPVWICASALSSHAHPDHQRATSLAIPMCGVGAGTFLVPLVYNGLHGALGASGWRVTWWVAAAGCAGLAVAVRSEILPVTRAARTTRDRATGLPWPLIVAYIGYGVGYSLMLTYFVIAVRREAHVTSAHAEIDQALIGLALVLGIGVGLAVDRLPADWGFDRRRVGPLVATCLLYAVSGPLVLLGREPWFALAAVCYGVGAAGNTVLIMTIVRDVVPRAHFVRAMALMTAVYAGTQVAAPLVGAYVGGPHSYRGAMVIIGAAGLMATAGSLSLWRRPSPEP